MYQVIWDDHEGKRRTLAFDNPADARLEAEALAARFDFVEVIWREADY